MRLAPVVHAGVPVRCLARSPDSEAAAVLRALAGVEVVQVRHAAPLRNALVLSPATHSMIEPSHPRPRRET